jgi:methylenetetrahydrofolate--tRNA-(uracil-5-)-methyltransferase
VTETSRRVTVIGAGLAGTECAFQLAERGVDVDLIEQKPLTRTAAQTGDNLAELVCSNSFRGADVMNAVGLLKEEMRRAGSLVIAVADAMRVPAGGALAVDREAFSAEMTRRIDAHPRIHRQARIVDRIPSERPVVIATGPLTGDALAGDLARAIGGEHLAYYDAIAPVVAAESIDWSLVFRASRYDKGGDEAYVNCPLNKEQYAAFVKAVIEADRIDAREFEQVRHFEGCLPVEVMAERGEHTLRFGPMKPVGLTDPKTGRWPYAVVQLPQEDHAATAWNIVGFQSRMRQSEQKRVFGMIPGLQDAKFERYGSVHRNTFVNAPRVLDDACALRAMPGVYLAGQITGVEGYAESASHGLVMGTLLAGLLAGRSRALPPPTTALGALFGHLRREVPDFQPSNVMWNMFPPPADLTLRKRPKKAAMAERALVDLDAWLDEVDARAVRARLVAGNPPQERVEVA